MKKINNKKPLNLFSAGNFDHKGGMKKGEVYILSKGKIQVIKTKESEK